MFARKQHPVDFRTKLVGTSGHQDGPTHTSPREARRTGSGWILALLFGLTVAALTAGPANAQGLMPGESILDRPRPELDATGMPVGAFRLFPTFDVTASHNSNIYALPANEIDDWITVITPALQLESDWVRHSVQFIADAEIGRYGQFDTENYEDTRLRFEGNLEVTQRNAFRFALQHRNDHVDRLSPDDVEGIEPTLFTALRAEGGYAFRGAKTMLDIDVDQEKLDFDDVPSADGGIIDNQGRDRTTTRWTFGGGYRINAELDALLQARTDVRDYRLDTNEFGLNRDSSGGTFGAGLQGALTGNTFLEALFGYAQRNYDDPTLPDIDTPWFDARLMWNPTGMTTLTFRADRELRETIFNESSGFTATNYRVRVDHELRRDVLLFGIATTSDQEYVGIDRDDDVYVLNLGARYLMNRFAQVTFEYRYARRDSESPDLIPDEFSRNLFMLSLRMQR